MANGTGTSGGWRGMNGAQRRVALLLGGGFLIVLAVVMAANATSMVSDFAAAGIPMTPAHVWLLEASSILIWLLLIPVIWWLVGRLWRLAWPWWTLAVIVVAATVPLSLVHVAGMVAIRKGVYALQGEVYRFTVGSGIDPWIYEYRKDVATILQFVGLAALGRWLIARAATPAEAPPRTLSVADGAVVHLIPADEIESVSAAGNYVELSWRGRTMLHRATLSAVEAELGETFVRIHRGRLVRRDAIRRIETEKSGDFAVELASGATLRGSRRYRPAD
ncbi:LytTR family DNA-binding domain-containing protein [Sphingomonas sp.]|uniref:LytTR family DNA-binding domain-containing protein n=1 Tax=Sphingomonas sp. TaxID=28214 RepID=UPI002E2F4339|nr:LytTR family transcriptional regulator DNA-binding domain-containing protein [Sphingomonas sp.]HEX4693041.1 LytTR family transcriptional regulator DNA-binding domain-containing protein [Sphingomonas sp.]